MSKKITKFFSSLKLTIFLLIILAFTSIIGTLIQQQQNPLIYVQQFGKPLYQIFKTLGFFDLYHSWWFISLLMLLALNLMFCSLKRLPRDLKLLLSPKVRLSEGELNSLSSKKTIEINNSSLDQSLEKALTDLKKSGFPCKHKVKDEKGWHLFSERGKFSRLAFHITHLSIILIFIGAILGAVKGFKGFVNITEGKKIDSITLRSGGSGLKNLGFEVECKKFEVSYYKDEAGNLTGRPKDYKSLLVIHDHGQEVMAKEIEVNDPLNYHGVYFYQSSFGEIPKLTITVKSPQGDLIDNFEAVEGGTFQFKDKNGQDTHVRILRYFPDFSMNQSRQIVNRSNIPNNPAALLQIMPPSGQAVQNWVFQRFPDFSHGTKTDYKYSLTSTASGKKYTGLEVVWDPGVPIVWTGCIILVLGIIIMFSVPHYRLWVMITNDGRQITVAGNTNKNKPSFQNAFSKVITIFKNDLADRKKVGK